MLVMSRDDFLWFVDDCLDDMTAILRRLGDDRANTAPELPGANSPYAIVTHCLGVMEFWGGRMVAGRPITRDRDAEFRATGPVEELITRTRRARAQLAEDLTALDAESAPPHPPDPGYADLPFGRTQGGVLLHLFHELAQHLGQMELSRDVLLARADPG